ncbi:MAG: hypothetical protein Q8S84_07910 [bacterium]|nr:hypothetical protein [bacterium]
MFSFLIKDFLILLVSSENCLIVALYFFKFTSSTHSVFGLDNHLSINKLVLLYISSIALIFSNSL